MDESWWPVILGCVGAVYISWQASGFVDRGVQEEQGQNTVKTMIHAGFALLPFMHGRT
jgi:hypothetical protein